MSLAKSRGAQKKATTTIAATTATAFVARLMSQVVSLVRFTPTHENGLPILVGFADLLGRARWDSNPNGFYCTSAQSEIEALKTKHRETWGKFPARGGCWKRI